MDFITGTAIIDSSQTFYAGEIIIPMSQLSDYLENVLLNAVLRNISYTSPSGVWLVLYTTDPTDADIGTEVSTVGTAYERYPISFTAPVNGLCVSTSQIDCARATGDWGVVAYGGIRDADVGGNLLFYGPLVQPRHVVHGDILRFQAGTITCRLS